jgi:phosphatidylserine/phosphatidylglycerophosphate/cardiolipin synthase-like enzyme
MDKVISMPAGSKSHCYAILFCQCRGLSKLTLFRPAANVIDEERLGSHAKFCVADGESAYVGSANLTGPGLAGQLEMGLLVHGECLSIDRN